MSAFTGVSQPDLEIELADIADKELCASKFESLTADLEDVARQKAILAGEHKWSDIENLPKPDKLVFETWNVIPDTYMNMKKYAFGVLSIFGSTYLCEQVFSSIYKLYKIQSSAVMFRNRNHIKQVTTLSFNRLLFSKKYIYFPIPIPLYI